MSSSAPAPGGGAALLAAQLGAPPREPVVLDFRLVDWRFGDFKKAFPAGATLADVKRELVARHGPLDRLDLFRDSPDEEHALPRSAAAEGSTLRELGIAMGGPRRDLPVVIFYSYVPKDATNPVLLANYLRGKLGTNAGAL